MFVGREKELKELDSLYHTGKLQLVGLYGRRHIGKTALVREFLQGKDHIYFQVAENNEKANLAMFRKRVAQYTRHIVAEKKNENGYKTDQANDSEQESTIDDLKLMESLFRLSESKTMILVLDEFQYLARNSTDLVRALAYMIQRFQKTSKMMVILTSSSLPYAEGLFHDQKSILAPHFTYTMKLESLDFDTSCKFLSKFTEEEKAILYGIVGGTPMYLRQMNPKMTIAENVKATFLDDSTQIFTEPEFLLRQEVREPALYHGILTAIATGAVRMSEISAEIGENTNVCSTYLKNLISMDLVHKEMPYGENGRKSIYTIPDPMLRFWYRFLPEHLSQITHGNADQVWKQIQPHLQTYMEPVFTEICRQYLQSQRDQGKSPVNFEKLGIWWGNDQENKNRIVIDLMGTDESDSAIFAECRWTNEKVDASALEQLMEKSRQFNCEKSYYYIFAKKGFTKECVNAAGGQKNVTLVTFRL